MFVVLITSWVQFHPGRILDFTFDRTLGFPGRSAGKESACNEGDLGSIPGLERSPGEGKSYPLQYSGPEQSITSELLPHKHSSEVLKRRQIWAGENLKLHGGGRIMLFLVASDAEKCFREE